MFLTCLQNEYLKIKSSFTFWLVSLGGVLVPLLVFFIQLFKPKYFVSRAASNPWDDYYADVYGAGVQLLFPLFLILVIALSFNIEHRAEGWKKSFVLPVKRLTFYLAKVSFIFLQVVYTLLVLNLSILLFGAILGLVHPELGFLDHNVELWLNFKGTIKILIAFLGLMGFQIILSYRFKNLIVSIGIGLFLFIFGSILFLWENSIYLPYSYHVHLAKHLKGMPVEEYSLGVFTYQLWSLIYFVLFLAVGFIMFRRKKI